MKAGGSVLLGFLRLPAQDCGGEGGHGTQRCNEWEPARGVRDTAVCHNHDHEEAPRSCGHEADHPEGLETFSARAEVDGADRQDDLHHERENESGGREHLTNSLLKNGC